jgi:hypothetical protein
MGKWKRSAGRAVAAFDRLLDAFECLLGCGPHQVVVILAEVNDRVNG